MEGREAGSPGHARAARHVARRFAELGLRPAVPGFFQSVPLRRAVLAGEPRITVLHGKSSQPIAHRTEARLRPSTHYSRLSLEATMVFAGHGLDEPALGIDDYRGLDLKGKIALLLAGAPAGLPPLVAAHLSEAKFDAAAARGAVGAVILPPYPTPYPGGPGETPQHDWIGRSGGTALPLRLFLNEAAARRLLAGSPHSLDRLRSQSRVAGFALAARLRVEAASRWQEMTSEQVIGLIPGSDPALASEHVVITAHLDHVGIKPDARPGEDRINNGAIDNGVGVAALIDIARRFREARERPRRSILLVATTAEEIGLLGADYLLHFSPVPRARMVAAINLDMPLPLHDFTDVHAHGADQSTLGEIAARAAGQMGIAVSADPQPQQMLFLRSDHYRFALAGVPPLFVAPGFANGGAEAWWSYFATAYHRPSDDMAQPIRWRSVARFAELNYRIARMVADAPQRPRWLPQAYFGRRLRHP